MTSIGRRVTGWPKGQTQAAEAADTRLRRICVSIVLDGAEFVKAIR